MKMTDEKPVAKLQYEERLRPEYLNSFRNTQHYQKSLAEGVQIEGKIIPVTLTDILTASDATKHVFTGTVEHKKTQHAINWRKDLYLNPTMRVIGAEDRVKLARAYNPQAFGEAIYNPESTIGFIAALERLAALEKAIKSTTKEETKENRQYLINRLTEFLKKEDGLNAIVLWTMEGGKPVKSARTSREAFENMVTYLVGRLQDEHKRNDDLTRQLFGGK